MTSGELLFLIRDLYSRLPETRHLRPWELGISFWFLNYTDLVEDEREIAAAVEVARTDSSRRSA